MRRPIKILIFSRYTEIGASSRLRIFQYLPYFENKNVSFKLSPFFNEKYLSDFYANKRTSIINVCWLYLKRFYNLLKVRQFDLIWVEKEVFPYMPSFFESLITLFRVKYIVDYDDAIFHNYEKFNSFLFQNKFNNFLQKASLVVVCNEYLEDYVSECGAKQIVQIPTVVDIDKYQHKNYNVINDDFRIGWIGSPSTTKYLYLIKDVLTKIAKKYQVILVIIGGSKIEDFGVPIEYHDWSIENENNLLSTFDIGIMPLFETKWEEGKCAFKIIQYMASGLPVVASNFGFNKSVVEANFGFLAKNEIEWQSAFEFFINNRDSLELYGRNAKKKADRFYSLESWSNEMLINIEKIVFDDL